MLPKTRLGKRSPHGALMISSPPMNQEMGGTSITMATRHQTTSKVKCHQGMKVYFQTGGAGEPSGVVDQTDLMQSEFTVRSSSHPSSSSSSSSRSVSSCIDVPRSHRTPADVDMDELMAAMVLSSLSCSPLLHSPAPPETTATLIGGGGSELSDGGSSGYWSVGCSNGSPAPSPPIPEAAVSPATPPDEGLDIELEQVLFDEPTARKRRHSGRAAYRCLWPSCGKVLTTVVGIKRHIRTTHLCGGGEIERCSRSEEDFYYSEINQWDEQQSPPCCGPAPATPTSSSPVLPPSPPPPPPPSPPSPACSALSRSAPSSGSSWQVQSEHSYQALPSSHVTTAAVSDTSCRWTAPPTSCLRQGLAIRVRSISVGEQWLQQQSAPCRRIRGEAKKCRKVYGIEHRDQWCTACRWKKACQRFLD